MAEPSVDPGYGFNRKQRLLTLSPYSVPGISAVPHEENLRYFDVEIHGPSQSPYEGTYANAAAGANLQ